MGMVDEMWRYIVAQCLRHYLFSAAPSSVLELAASAPMEFSMGLHLTLRTICHRYAPSRHETREFQCLISGGHTTISQRLDAIA